VEEEIVSIEDEKKEINETFSRMFVELSNEVKIGNMSVRQWLDFFTVRIPSNPDMFLVRELIIETSNKIDLCADIISQLKNAIGVSEQEETIIVKQKFNELNQTKMSFAAKEREAKSAAAEAKMLRNMGTFLLSAFETQIFKLKDKIHSLELINMSIGSEVKLIRNS